MKKLILSLILTVVLAISLIGLSACDGNGYNKCPDCGYYPSRCQPAVELDPLNNFNVDFITDMRVSFVGALGIGIVNQSQLENHTDIEVATTRNSWLVQQTNSTELVYFESDDEVEFVDIDGNEVEETVIDQEQIPAQINRMTISRGFTFIQFIPLVQNSGYYYYVGEGYGFFDNREEAYAAGGGSYERIRVNLRPDNADVNGFDYGPFYTNSLSSSFIIDNTSGYIYAIEHDVVIDGVYNGVIWMSSYKHIGYDVYEPVSTLHVWGIGEEGLFITEVVGAGAHLIAQGQISGNYRQWVFRDYLDRIFIDSRIAGFAIPTADNVCFIDFRQYNTVMSDQQVLLQFYRNIITESWREGVLLPPTVLSITYTLVDLTFYDICNDPNTRTNRSSFEVEIVILQIYEDSLLVTYRRAIYERYIVTIGLYEYWSYTGYKVWYYGESFLWPTTIYGVNQYWTYEKNDYIFRFDRINRNFYINNERINRAPIESINLGPVVHDDYGNINIATFDYIVIRENYLYRYMPLLLFNIYTQTFKREYRVPAFRTPVSPSDVLQLRPL